MADPKDLTWRVGRNIPRNLYEGDRDVGRMDTPELARRVVTAMNTNGSRAALLDLAARAEAVGLLERCRGVLRGTARATRSWTVAGLLADLDTFLGPSEGAGGAVATEEKRAEECHWCELRPATKLVALCGECWERIV